MKFNSRLGLVLFVAAALSAFATASTAAVLFQRGPGGYNINAHLVNGANYTADSFTLTQASQIEGFTVPIWIRAGTLVNLDWAFLSGTPADPATQVLASTLDVTPATSSQIQPAASVGLNGTYRVFAQSYTVSPFVLQAGTYFLRLSGATSSNGDAVFWDQANTTPTGVTGSLLGGTPSPIPGRTFQILGFAAPAMAVPEPATWTMMITGFGLAGTALRRRTAGAVRRGAH